VIVSTSTAQSVADPAARRSSKRFSFGAKCGRRYRGADALEMDDVHACRRPLG
jgi:hypothetical protein